MSSRDACYWIEKLQLAPHPEGGYFRETYRADLQLHALPAAFHGPRSASTAVYFLLEGDDFSAFHRLASDELWHFYDGASLAVHVIHPTGDYELIRLGRDLETGEASTGRDPAPPIKRETSADLGAGRESVVLRTSVKVLQASVAAGCWFASSLLGSQGFALVGCTVAPGFDYADFEMANREALIAAHPRHRDLIERYTRANP